MSGNPGGFFNHWLNGVGGLIVVGVVSAIGYGLYTQLQAVNVMRHYEITGTMTRLDGVDSAWNEAVLKSRVGLNPNYDALVQTRARQLELGAKLGWLIDSVAPGAARVSSSLAVYAETAATKLETTERFKSEYAILRNSSEYIPFGVHTLVEMIESHRGTSVIDGGSLRSLSNRLERLIVNLLDINSESYAPKSLKRKLVELSAFLKANPVPHEMKTNLLILIAHVKTIMAKKSVVETLVNNLIAMPTSAHLDDVREAYVRDHRARVATASDYQILFFIYCGVVLIALAYKILSLYAAHRRRIDALSDENADLATQVQLAQELAEAKEKLDETELELFQSEKMSALGQMVAGVAHEINTPLAYTRSNVELIHDEMPAIIELVGGVKQQIVMLEDVETTDDQLAAQFARVGELAVSLSEDELLSQLYDLMKSSLDGLDNIRQMVIDMKDFSRLDRKQLDAVNLHHGINSTLTIAHNTIKYKAEIVTEYGELPLVTCAPSQINQVVLNLLVNAAQAINDKGRILIKTERVHDEVMIHISDNGPGIPDKVLGHIFEPYYTTKPPGEGTGMGLSISRQIVEKHGGTLTVSTQMGIGSCFTMTLPIEFAGDPGLVDEVTASQG